MSSSSKPRVPESRAAQRQLEQALVELRSTDPKRYAEHMAATAALIQRAERWRAEPVRLPRGVAVVAGTDEYGDPVHTIDWGPNPPFTPPVAFHDPVVAVELVWTAFMLRRPWAIDDERLRALVARPPVPHASILGDLLAIRFTEWVRQAYAAMAEACINDPPPKGGAAALQGVFRSFLDSRHRYEARATLAIHQLAGGLEVEEPDSGFEDELSRWRWMQYDYALALDPPLHDRLESLTARYATAKPNGVREAWDDLQSRRQLDACLGLLLARATMLDSPPRTGMLGYVDPMATQAPGSFAWWCRWMLDAWEDEYPLGERLRDDEVEKFVGFALHELEALDAGLLATLLGLFPMLRS